MVLPNPLLRGSAHPISILLVEKKKERTGCVINGTLHNYIHNVTTASHTMTHHYDSSLYPHVLFIVALPCSILEPGRNVARRVLVHRLCVEPRGVFRTVFAGEVRACHQYESSECATARQHKQGSLQPTREREGGWERERARGRND